jgi:hypothetical protein
MCYGKPSIIVHTLPDPQCGLAGLHVCAECELKPALVCKPACDCLQAATARGGNTHNIESIPSSSLLTLQVHGFCHDRCAPCSGHPRHERGCSPRDKFFAQLQHFQHDCDRRHQPHIVPSILYRRCRISHRSGAFVCTRTIVCVQEWKENTQ